MMAPDLKQVRIRVLVTKDLSALIHNVIAVELNMSALMTNSTLNGNLLSGRNNARITLALYFFNGFY